MDARETPEISPQQSEEEVEVTQATPAEKKKRKVSEKQLKHLAAIRGKALAVNAIRNEAAAAKKAEAEAKRAEIAARKKAAADALLEQEKIATAAMEAMAAGASSSQDKQEDVPEPKTPRKSRAKARAPTPPPTSESDTSSDSDGEPVLRRTSRTGADRLAKVEQELLKLRYKLKYSGVTASNPPPIGVPQAPLRQQQAAPAPTKQARFANTDLSYFSPLGALGI